jgi:hypothetical protein
MGNLCSGHKRRQPLDLPKNATILIRLEKIKMIPAKIMKNEELNYIVSLFLPNAIQGRQLN